MNRLPIIAVHLLLAALALIQGECLAAAGDVSFQAANKTVQLNPGNLATSVDVFFHVAGAANVPAIGWGMIVNIAPQAGATGTVRFNPPTIVSNQPNLMPASQTPFIDFDRDFGGKSYGTLGQSNTQLNAFSYYYRPDARPAAAAGRQRQSDAARRQRTRLAAALGLFRRVRATSTCRLTRTPSSRASSMRPACRRRRTSESTQRARTLPES